MSNPQKNARRLAVFVLALFLIWSLRATWLFAIDESISSPILKAGYSNMIKFVIWVLPAAAYGYWGKGETPQRYLGLSTLPTRRQWLVSLSAIAVFLLAVSASEMFVNGKSISLAALFSTPLPMLILSYLCTPLMEELCFRGCVLQEMLELLPPFAATLLTSLLFVGMHLPYWIYHGRSFQLLMANMAGVFLFSLLAGWLFSLTKSVWPPTLAHTANNLLASVLVSSRG